MNNTEKLIKSLYQHGLLKHAGSSRDAKVIDAFFPNLHTEAAYYSMQLAEFSRDLRLELTPAFSQQASILDNQIKRIKEELDNSDLTKPLSSAAKSDEFVSVVKEAFIHALLLGYIKFERIDSVVDVTLKFIPTDVVLSVLKKHAYYVYGKDKSCPVYAKIRQLDPSFNVDQYIEDHTIRQIEIDPKHDQDEKEARLKYERSVEDEKAKINSIYELIEADSDESALKSSLSELYITENLATDFIKYAVDHGSKDSVKVLLELPGVDLDTQYNDDLSSLVVRALSKGYNDIAEMIMDHVQKKAFFTFGINKQAHVIHTVAADDKKADKEQKPETHKPEKVDKKPVTPPDVDMGEYRKVKEAVAELIKTDPKAKSELQKLVNSQKTFKAKVEELLSKQDFGDGIGKPPTLSDAGYTKLLQEVFHVAPPKDETKDKKGKDKGKGPDKGPAGAPPLGGGPEGGPGGEAPGGEGEESGGMGDLGDLDALLGL